MHRLEEEYGVPGRGGEVARVVYASRCLVRGPVYTEMEKIRASALKHNAPRGVATALLHQSGWFVQWKEGPPAAVGEIMERIARDPRHHDLRTVHGSRGPRLLAGLWSMATVQCRDAPGDMERRVLRLQQQVAAGRQFGPPALWRRLSTPMRHPGALRQEDPDVFQRVLVCSASGTEPFALVQWLARRSGEEVVRRRFAGALSLDVATDYVDFVQDERVLRVIAMARHGLHLPLTRAFLPDYSHLVLLLTAEGAANARLVERVLQACDGLPHVPALVGVAVRPEMHAAPAALARRWGVPYAPAFADPAGAAATWQSVLPLLAQWQQAPDSSPPWSRPAALQ